MGRNTIVGDLNDNAGGRDEPTAADSGVAIGFGANTQHNFGVALGANATTDAPIPYPTASLAGTSYNFAGGAPLAVVSVGTAAQQRQIINLGAGRISSDSTDAINGSQMFAAFSEIGKNARNHTALQTQVDALAAQMAAAQGGGNGGGTAEAVVAAIGPGASVSDDDGSLILPPMSLASAGLFDRNGEPKIQPTTILGAIDSLDDELVKTNDSLGALVDNALLRDLENPDKFDAQDSKIANVAAGTAATDAVNLGQLEAVGDEALTTAQTAQAAAEGAQTAAATAQTAAEGAQSAAEGAQATAEGAQATADGAQTAAQTAQSAADGAQATAEGAQTAAQGAQNTANAAQTAASAAQDTANGADGKADAALAGLGGGAAVAADGTVTPPGYGVAVVGPDGNIDAAGSTHTTVGDALDALGDNVVNLAGVTAEQGEAITALNQNALLWNEDAGAFTAARNSAPQQIANVAAGTAATDAVNVSQLEALGGEAMTAAAAAQATANAAHTTAYAAEDAAATAQITAEGAQTAAEGAQTAAQTAQSTAEGAQTAASTAQTTADGAQTAANAAQTAAVTAQAAADSADGKADGALAGLGGGAALAANGTVTPPSYEVATIGIDGSVIATGLAHDNVGAALNAMGDNVVNLAGVAGRQGEAITLLNQNALLWNDDAGAFTAARNGAPQQIANVAVGTATTDAVNLGQLAEVSDDVETLRQTTGQELSAANDGIARLEQAGTMAVTYGAAPSGGRGNTIGLVGGDPNAPVLIANVARGSADNDAVNVQHLNESQANTAAQAEAYTDRVATQTLASANHYTDSAVSQLSGATGALAREVRDGFGQLASDISAVSIEARQAAAIGLAASSLRFNDTPGKLSLAAAGGFWQGQGALALGLGYTSDNGDVRMNLTGVTSGGHIGVGGGFSVTLN